MKRILRPMGSAFHLTVGLSIVRFRCDGLPSRAMRITAVATEDLRARTSLSLAGSDAVHNDPDYSAAYLILRTDGDLEGHGFTFTIGRGNELCVGAIEALAPHVVGSRVEDLIPDLRGLWRRLVSDSQLRWLGPEKGVIHLATAALVNAVWDLYAR